MNYYPLFLHLIEAHPVGHLRTIPVRLILLIINYLFLTSRHTAHSPLDGAGTVGCRLEPSRRGH